jgi:hypothetical protein
MKTFIRTTSVAALVAAVKISAAPMSSVFTYQGKLSDGSSPANGVYDFEFRIADAPSNSVPFALNSLYSVAVTNGLFSVPLDFGAGYLNGDARWLEIGVKPAGGTNFVTLMPRTALTAAPYALYSDRAGTAIKADSVEWSAIQGVPPSVVNATNGSSYSAGTGLSLSGANQFSVNFAGSGAAASASRSDHNHFGQVWSGSGTNGGLDVRNTLSYGSGLVGRQGAGSGLPWNVTAGVYGHATDGDGVVGSSAFRGVFGIATSTNAENYGVYGHSPSRNGFGVYGNSPGAGVYGNSDDPSGYGVYGKSKGAGVYGSSENLYGVYGRTLNTNAVNFGVFGTSPSKNGYGVYGNASSPTGVNYGVAGVSSSTLGRGVQGWATADTGTNYGGWFMNEAGAGAGVFAQAQGAAAGVQAVSQNGHAGKFEIINNASSASAMKVNHQGMGHAGEFSVLNQNSAADAVNAWHNGDGDAISAFHTGDGKAGKFYAAGNGTGVYAHSSGGVGLEAHSTGTNAVRVFHSHASAAMDVESLNASAIRAKAYNKKAAIEIAGGAFKVTGAGFNTGTAAFVHKVNSSNTTFNDAPNAGEQTTGIDNPLCNSRSDAILIITPRISDPWSTHFQDLSVGYDSSSGYWFIQNFSSDEFGDFDEGDEINVMLILP